MFCENCGAEIPDNSKFCPSCGHPVAGTNDSAAAPEPSRPEPAPADGSQTPASPSTPATEQPAQVPAAQPSPSAPVVPPAATTAQADGSDASGAVPPAPMPQTPQKKRRAWLIIAIVAACMVLIALVVLGMRGHPGHESDDGGSHSTTVESSGSPTDTNDFDDLGDGTDAEGFSADSSGSYAVSDAPDEGHAVAQVGDTIYYISDDKSQLLARPRAGGDETAVYTADEFSGIDVVASDGTYLYITQIDYSNEVADLLQLNADGSVADDLVSSDSMNSVYGTELYVAEDYVGFVALEYDDEENTVTSQHLYYAFRETKNAYSIDLSEDARDYDEQGYCMTDDAFWYIVDTENDSGDDVTDLHRVDLKSHDDESVYCTTTPYNADGVYAGDDGVYLAFDMMGKYRIFAIDEDGLEGGFDFEAPDIDGATSEDFSPEYIYIDRSSGHIIVTGIYYKPDDSVLQVVVTSNMDGSNTVKALDCPADPNGEEDYAAMEAYACGSGFALEVGFSSGTQYYVADIDGQNPLLYHEYVY